MEQTSKIYIAGHNGMVGSGLERKLRKEGYNNIVTRTSSELDLRNQQAVNDFFVIILLYPSFLNFRSNAEPTIPLCPAI